MIPKLDIHLSEIRICLHVRVCEKSLLLNVHPFVRGLTYTDMDTDADHGSLKRTTRKCPILPKPVFTPLCKWIYAVFTLIVSTLWIPKRDADKKTPQSVALYNAIVYYSCISLINVDFLY